MLRSGQPEYSLCEKGLSAGGSPSKFKGCNNNPATAVPRPAHAGTRTGYHVLRLARQRVDLRVCRS
jgi:hypothetical protein